MRNPQGYATWFGGDGKDIERDTVTCCHCGAVVHVDPPPAPVKTGFCRLCMDHTCPTCAASLNCTPFEKRLEGMEARDRLRRSI